MCFGLSADIEHNLTELQQQQIAKEFNCESLTCFFLFVFKYKMISCLDAYDTCDGLHLTEAQLIFLINVLILTLLL